MSTAKGRIWKRLLKSGRTTKAGILDLLGENPTHAELLDAAYAFEIAADGLSDAELFELLKENA